VELHGADARAIRALGAPAMTREIWESFFAVRVVREPTAGGDLPPPLLGSYRLAGDVVRFEPRFPLEPGIRYRAEFNPSSLDAAARSISPAGAPNPSRPPSPTTLTAEISLPQRDANPTTKVDRVYPSSSTLPENLLRFYIHFSAPMSRGEAYDHIRLLDPTGKPVEGPFLELHEELWSADGTRFTLLFDPGRIKRGLKPREELGPVLEAGKSYDLVIDREWTDSAGRPLKTGFRKSFRALAADESSPDPKDWSVQSPRPDTRDPVEIRFPRALDRALLDRLLAVQDQAGKIMPGQVTVDGAETIWRLEPVMPWRAGDYRLVIGTDLEDVAGNSIARPFEVDLSGPISRQVLSNTVNLPFRIGARSR
jgi:hypothetical protein